MTGGKPWTVWYENEEYVSVDVYKKTKEKYKAMKLDIDEQCRINAMGQERELKLITANNTLKEQIKTMIPISEVEKLVEALEGAEASIAVLGVTAYGRYNSKCEMLLSVKRSLSNYKQFIENRNKTEEK